MSQAKVGDKVSVHYTGKLENGEMFDTSEGRSPLEFTIGQKQMIPGFEQAVIGLGEGGRKTVSIPAAEAYGEHRPELIEEVKKSELPPDLQSVEAGQQLEAHQNGQRFVVQVVEVGDDSIKLDANHPLAGETLIFDIELVKIHSLLV